MINDVGLLLKMQSNKHIPSEVLLRNDSCWVVFYSVHWKQQRCGNLMKGIKLNPVPFFFLNECIWWIVASKADMLSPVSGLYLEIVVEVNKNSVWSNIWMCSWDSCAMIAWGHFKWGCEGHRYDLSPLTLFMSRWVPVPRLLLCTRKLTKFHGPPTYTYTLKQQESSYLIEPYTRPWRDKGRTKRLATVCVCVSVCFMASLPLWSQRCQAVWTMGST